MSRSSPTGPTPAVLAALALAGLAALLAPRFAPDADRPGAAPAAEIGYRMVGEELRVAVRLPDAGPWRGFLLDGPPRLVIDAPPGPPPAPAPAPPAEGLLKGARAGVAASGRPRLVLDLAGPARLLRAELARLPGGPTLRLALAPGRPALTGWPEGAEPSHPAPLAPPGGDARPLVMIDPGHGGFDPGAVRDGAVEKRLVLAFAKDLAAALDASGRWRAALTRDRDVHLSLAARPAMAEAAGAAAFLSIHANTVARGDAIGVSVFTLSDGAADAEAEALAALENRAGAVEGVDLAADGDDVARALIDLTRRRALARGRALGEALAGALGEATPMLRGRAHMQAGFRVLTSPETPSALIELGFLTNPGDLARMRDPAWRRRAAEAIVTGLDRWRRPEDGPGLRPAAPPDLAALPPMRPWE